MSFLPPEEVAQANALLAIIADPKAHAARLAELVKASDTYRKLQEDVQTTAANNSVQEKALAEAQKVFGATKKEFTDLYETEKPKLKKLHDELTGREAALAKALQDLADRQRAFNVGSAEHERGLKGREANVSAREDDLKNREVAVKSREDKVSAKEAKFRELVG